MIKKLVTFAAAALFSLNASAGYIQWNVESSALSGYIVQNEQDLSIAYFELNGERPNEILYTFAPYMGYSDIAWVKAQRNNKGPSNFEIANEDTEGLSFHIRLNFSGTGDPDTYRFRSFFKFEQVWSPFPDGEYTLPTVTHRAQGKVTRGEVNPQLASQLDYYLEATDGERYDDLLHHVVPELNVVPEPTSIALFALGAVGLAGIRRRKTAN